MSIEITMLQSRRGEDGTVWAAGTSHVASDAFAAQMIGANLATGTLPGPTSTGLTPAAAAALAASEPGAKCEVALRTNVRLPIIRSGSYTGTGSRRRVRIGFRPDWVMVKDQAGATYALWRHPGTWRGRQPYLGQAVGHATASMVELTDDGFIVTSGADSNTAATAYSWIAIADNGSGKFLCGSYVGNGVDGRSLARMIEEEPVAIFLKRDNTFNCWVRMTGMDQAYPLNGGTPSATVISSLNPVTVSNANDVNTESTAIGNGAEGMDWFAFLPCDSWSVFQHAGTGVDPTVVQIPGFSDEDAIALAIIKSHADVSANQNAHVLFPEIAHSTTFAANGTANAGTHVNTYTGSSLELDDGIAANEADATYTIFVLKETPEDRVPVRKARPAFLNRAALRCGTAGGVLTQAGQASGIDISAGQAWTLEFAGSVRSASTDDVLVAIASADSVRSFALRVSNAFDQLLVDQYDGSADAFEVGTRPARGALVHIVLRCFGQSTDKRDLMLTLDGRFHKEFGRDNPVTMPAGTKLSILACRDTDDALASSAEGSEVALVRFYDRALTNAEVQVRRDRFYGVADVADVDDFVEEWDAANVSNGLLHATRSPANSGVITTCTLVTV